MPEAQEHRFHSMEVPPGGGIGKLKSGEINRGVFSQWAGPSLPVWIYVPQGVNVSAAPILFVMHGNKRDPHRYLRQWRPLAQQYGFIAVGPEFSAKDFPKSAGYNLGNVFRQEGHGKWAESLWSFSAIEPLFDAVKAALDSKQQQYTLFGHSAGAQFVHRFLYYKPNARVKRFIAANAGWYTQPDPTQRYPYGLDGADLPIDNLKLALSKPLLVLLGTADNNPAHKSLRKTPEAMQQGPHRFARGHYFYRQGQSQAKDLGVKFGWSISEVKGIAHSNSGMAAAAAQLID